MRGVRSSARPRSVVPADAPAIVPDVLTRTPTMTFVAVPADAQLGARFTLRNAADGTTIASLTIDEEVVEAGDVAPDALALEFIERTTVEHGVSQCTGPFDQSPTTYSVSVLVFSSTLHEEEATGVVVDVWRADQADRDDERAPRLLDTQAMPFGWLDAARGRMVIPLDDADADTDVEVRLRAITAYATGARASSTEP